MVERCSSIYFVNKTQVNLLLRWDKTGDMLDIEKLSSWQRSTQCVLTELSKCRLGSLQVCTVDPTIKNGTNITSGPND